MFEIEPKTCLAFTVYGLPQPAGSKRGFAFQRKNGSTGVAISDANPKSREWKNLVTDAVRAKYDGDPLQGPLKLSLVFFLPRPQGHFRTGKSTAGTLKPSAPQYPTVKPDVLKLARAVEDALSHLLYVDDAQIVREEISKHYASRGYVKIFVERMQDRHDLAATETEA